MMNSQKAINEIHALVAKSEVNDEVAEKLLAISSWLEAEQEEVEGLAKTQVNYFMSKEKDIPYCIWR